MPADAAKRSNATRLKVGLMLDSLTQPQWVYDIVDGIQQSGFAEVSLLIHNGDVDTPHRGLQRILRNRHRIAYALYTRLDDRLFRRQPDAFTERSIADLVAGVPSVRVVPIKKKFSDYFDAADVAAIRAHGLDVALRLGFRILKGDSLHIARYGVWSYHHGDNLVNRGGPPGFWEVMQQEAVTGSVLQVLTDELDNGQVIYRSYAPTDARSVRRNLDNFYRKSSTFVLRKLRELSYRGAAALECDPHAETFTPYCRPLYKEPGNLAMTKMAARLFIRYAADKLRSTVYLDQWAVAYRLNPALSAPDPGMHRYKLLLPPVDRFWADPFPVVTAGRQFIFVEELQYSSGKGHISVLELDKKGELRGVEPVLEQEHHLSYPFVFEWKGAHFMIPDSGDRRRVEIFRASDFPRGWQLENVLLDNVFAVDATLHEADGVWWMFTNVGEEGTWNHDELHLFHAASPLGPWQPHAMNPVKSDARSARPAGRLFWWKGSLYRPSQDCSGHYGRAVVINKVLRLSPAEYQEVEVSRLEPRWAPNLLGTHTLNAAPGISVADVLVRRRRAGATGTVAIPAPEGSAASVQRVTYTHAPTTGQGSSETV
jgi:methionyl-tRNA formyltransferase